MRNVRSIRKKVVRLCSIKTRAQGMLNMFGSHANYCKNLAHVAITKMEEGMVVNLL